MQVYNMATVDVRRIDCQSISPTACGRIAKMYVREQVRFFIIRSGLALRSRIQYRGYTKETDRKVEMR